MENTQHVPGVASRTEAEIWVAATIIINIFMTITDGASFAQEASGSVSCDTFNLHNCPILLGKHCDHPHFIQTLGGLACKGTQLGSA